LKPRSP